MATALRTYHPASQETQRIRIIGVPMDLGASRRGVDMGPSAMRVATLADRLRHLGHTVDDRGNVEVPDRALVEGSPSEIISAIARVCTQLAALTADAIRSQSTPLVLGGDHSLAAGSIAGVATALAERGESLGVLWLDAHGDIHDPDSSPSGNVHGMPVAHLLGRGDPRLSRIASPFPAIKSQHLVYVGLRDLDPPEQAYMRAEGIHAFTMRDVDERGLRAVMNDAIAIASDGTAGIHVSCDADWIDPAEAPGVGTPVRGGATVREAHLAMEILADSDAMISMDLVEINPILDRNNGTAELAVDLIASAFGRRIL